MTHEASTALRRILCEAWCSELDVAEDRGAIRLSMPLTEPDGDYVTVWLRQTLGGWRIEDAGATLMRFSYDQDIGTLASGPRAIMLRRLLSEYGARLDEDGQIKAEATETDLGHTLLRFGQAILRVGELRSWTKSRVASTFFDDLEAQLKRIAGPKSVRRNHIWEGIPAAEDYPIDFYLEGATEPLFVFGAPTKDRARLATIVLQHLQQHIASFNSIVVFQDASAIGNADLRRLMNAANDMVDSLGATDTLRRKVLHRLVA
ncbi:DUF1828 domain-containing protein [Cupriavidus gilardii]|uniref:DUF1828 domain-containing protein n=1 Tax=Cupriavidus gilardii TaxID=82541 RepID=A0ABY4VYA7_9BURK|nr:DUF1828 domain-containing protein [Cupriavidus gilardii]USE81177.1 DUF1828 domain-containing protein [Cupriavidus gilardii]